MIFFLVLLLYDCGVFLCICIALQVNDSNTCALYNQRVLCTYEIECERKKRYFFLFIFSILSNGRVRARERVLRLTSIHTKRNRQTLNRSNVAK